MEFTKKQIINYMDKYIKNYLVDAEWHINLAIDFLHLLNDEKIELIKLSDQRYVKSVLENNPDNEYTKKVNMRSTPEVYISALFHMLVEILISGDLPDKWKQGRLIKLSCNKEDTVYDVDNVVEQLKTDSSVKLYGSGNSDNYLIPVKRAINIVKAAAPNDSNFKNDKDLRKLCEGYMQQGYNQAILDFIHELDNYCGYYEGKIKNLTRDGVLEVAEQLRKKINDEACDDDMLTIEELIYEEIPFLSMNDITDNDWQMLDFKLEKYDRANEDYDLNECKVLAFILQQIHYDKANFFKVPNFIRNGRKFQELVVKYNPQLMHILFPTR